MADAFEPRFADLVRIYTTTQGTGDFVAGAAATGFHSFDSTLEIGDQFYYCAQHSDRPSEHEIGRGTLRADGKIARDPVGGNLTMFSPGTKTVALVAAAEWHTLTQQRLNETAAVAAAAAEGVADVGSSLIYTADAPGAVERTYLSKLRECVSFKDFGAIGDGVADDSAAVSAAFQHGAMTGTPIFVPQGTFLVDPSMLELIECASSFTLFGTGPASIIKIKDGAVDADDDWMFMLSPWNDMDVIEIRDLLLDHNARGSAPPPSLYDYQHSHTIFVKVPPGVTVKQVRFENIVIEDPAADGISNGGTGDINSYVVANCAEFGRTRVRSSIVFSRLPDNVLITGFVGPLIEIESNGASPTLKRVHISNCSVEVLDLAAHPADGTSKLVELSIDNVSATVSAVFQDLLLRASNCRLRVPADGRWNRLSAGSRVSGSTILNPYDASANTIVSLSPFWEAGITTDLEISNCDFVIDSTDPAIAPIGAMVFPQSATPAAEVANQRLAIEDCRFDARCASSVYAHRCGTVKLLRNRYGGRDAAIFLGVTAGKAIDATVDGGDFAYVSGAAVKVSWMTIDPATTFASYCLTGEWTGVQKPVANWAGAPSRAAEAPFRSNRRMMMASQPAGGVIGDIFELEKPTEGGADEYRCTTSSATAATWRATRQAGVRKDTTAARPTLTANDAGLRYLDTSLAPAGKPIVWTGSAWVDASGAAV
jgi:hypothetical protein